MSCRPIRWCGRHRSARRTSCLSQARERLARVQDLAAGAGDRGDVATGLGGGGGKGLQEVQGAAFAGQDGARRTADFAIQELARMMSPTAARESMAMSVSSWRKVRAPRLTRRGSCLARDQRGANVCRSRISAAIASPGPTAPPVPGIPAPQYQAGRSSRREAQGRAVSGSRHAGAHRDREHEVGTGGQHRNLAGLRLLFIGGRDDAQDLLLVGPDQHPH